MCTPAHVPAAIRAASKTATDGAPGSRIGQGERAQRPGQKPIRARSPRGADNHRRSQRVVGGVDSHRLARLGRRDRQRLCYLLEQAHDQRGIGCNHKAAAGQQCNAPLDHRASICAAADSTAQPGNTSRGPRPTHSTFVRRAALERQNLPKGRSMPPDSPGRIVKRFLRPYLQ
jgi:hypothetical protein